MTNGDEVFQQIQNKARSDASKEGRPTPTAEYLTRHALESFLDRLTRTGHKDDFVLKGGILLAVYGVRRPTRDVDAEAINATVTPEHIAQVVRDVAAVDVEDGVRFELDTISVREIRESAEYGRRVARRSRGLEGALVDRESHTIAAFDPADDRVRTMLVAGPAALLVAKVHEIVERLGDRDRAQDKDALDVFRLLQAVSSAELARRLKTL